MVDKMSQVFSLLPHKFFLKSLLNDRRLFESFVKQICLLWFVNESICTWLIHEVKMRGISNFSLSVKLLKSNSEFVCFIVDRSRLFIIWHHKSIPYIFYIVSHLIIDQIICVHTLYTILGF